MFCVAVFIIVYRWDKKWEGIFFGPLPSIRNARTFQPIVWATIIRWSEKPVSTISTSPVHPFGLS